MCETRLKARVRSMYGSRSFPIQMIHWVFLQTTGNSSAGGKGAGAGDSPCKCRPLSEPHRQYLKSHSPLNQRSRVAKSSSAEGRLPSPASSMPQSIDRTMPLNDSSLGQSSRATLLALTEITFRLYSVYCYSFTAVVRDSCDGRGVSLDQVDRLIASIGYMGKMDDVTIKSLGRYSYLLSGFSRHPSSQPSSCGDTVSTAEVGCIHSNTTRT
jgi:hypothetical protein